MINAHLVTRLTNGTWCRLHCPFFTEMALSAVLTLVLPRPSKVRIISSIRAWKLLSHSSTQWTVKPRWAGTSGCCLSTWTVLPFITDVTLWGVKQISSAGVCPREARKFGCWARPYENKVKCCYMICYTRWLSSAILTIYKILMFKRQTMLHYQDKLQFIVAWLLKYLSAVKCSSIGSPNCVKFLKSRTLEKEPPTTWAQLLTRGNEKYHKTTKYQN